METKKLDKVLAENIKKYRKLRGYTQPKLAEISKLSFRSIQDIEYGKAWPGVDTIGRIAHALGVPSGALFEIRKGMSDEVQDKTKEQLLVSIFGELLKFDDVGDLKFISDTIAMRLESTQTKPVSNLVKRK